MKRVAQVQVMRRGASLTFAVCAAALVVSCDKSPATDTDRAQSSASSQTGERTIDWDVIQAADAEAASTELSRLARLVDCWHRGKSPSVTLRCYADGYVSDGTNRAAADLRTWKAVVVLIENTPGQKTATRAVPGRAYNDGFGRVPRHAYFVEVEENGRLAFSLVKPLGDTSGG